MYTYKLFSFRLALTGIFSFLLVLLGGCGSLDSIDSFDSGDEEENSSELQRQVVGCWNWMETRNGDGTQPNANQTGVITSGPGNSRELNCNEDGSYSDTFMQDGETSTITGTWTIEDGDKICFTTTGGEFQICYDGQMIDGILQLIRIATEGNVSYWNLQSFSRGCQPVQ